MWRVHTTINYEDAYRDEVVQGPWTIEAVNDYIRTVTQAETEATSFEFILIPVGETKP